MQLNPAEISELIKSRIEGLGVSANIRNEGTVVSVTDGIVRVHGLSDAMAGEMLEFPPTADGQPTYGLALNLERDSAPTPVRSHPARWPSPARPLETCRSAALFRACSGKF